MAIVPVTMFASNILWFVFIAGFIFGITGLIKVALLCFLVMIFFQLITLPVEFDASRRAKIILQQMGMVRSGEEMAGVNNVLNAAALTYVAALVATIGQFLYYFLLSRRN